MRAICEPEKWSRSSRSSRSSHQPDAKPDDDTVFNPPETTLSKLHAKGFLPLWSLSILLTPLAITPRQLLCAGACLVLDHAAFGEKVGQCQQNTQGARSSLSPSWVVSITTIAGMLEFFHPYEQVGA